MLALKFVFIRWFNQHISSLPTTISTRTLRKGRIQGKVLAFFWTCISLSCTATLISLHHHIYILDPITFLFLTALSWVDLYWPQDAKFKYSFCLHQMFMCPYLASFSTWSSTHNSAYESHVPWEAHVLHLKQYDIWDLLRWP